MKIRSTMITMTAVLGILALAPAAQATAWTFTSTTDGEWTQDGHWNLPGYPDAAGDTASFVDIAYDTSLTGFTVGSDVTIGSVSFHYMVFWNHGNGRMMQLTGPGSLTFDNNGEVSESHWGRFISLAVEEIILTDAAIWRFDGRTSGTISSTISDDGSSPTLTFRFLDGSGATYTIAGTSPNTYSGTTVVETARLILSKDGAIPGDLIMGNPNGFNRAPEVRVTYASADDDRIADSASVSLYSDGTRYAKMTLDANVYETVGGLYLDGIQQPFGTWGSSNSTATYTDNNWFGGSGVLNVIPEPGTIALLGLAGLVMLIRRRFVK